METWQEAFIEQYPHLTFHVAEHQLIIEQKNRKFTLGLLQNGLGITYAKFFRFANIKDDLLTVMIAYVETYAKAHHHKMIIFDENYILYKHELFYSKGYHKVPDTMKIATGGLFYKQLAKGLQKQLTKKTKRIFAVLEHKKQREVFFVYQPNSSICLHEITLYYKGYESVITTRYEQGNLVWYAEEERFVLTSDEDIASSVDMIAQKMEKKTRIKNHFTPPRVHFDHKSKTFNFSNDLIDRIHHILLAHYTWEEIESYFYYIRPIDLAKKMIDSFSYPRVLQLLNHFLVLDETKDYIFSIEEHEKASAMYEEILAKKAANEAKREFERQFPTS